MGVEKLQSRSTALKRTRTAILVCSLAATVLVGCSKSSNLKLGSSGHSQGNSNGQSQNQQGQGGGSGQSGANQAASCSISVYEGILDESSAADQQQTSSWTLVQKNNWTVFLPDSSWVLSASSAGGMDADTGGFDASEGSLYAAPGGGAWTTSGIFAHELSAVSNVKVICSTSVESDSSGSSQAEEFTGGYQGNAVHGILIASVLAPYGYGEIHSFYTPGSQWSTANVTMLSLILKRAILSPSSVNP